MINKLLLLCSFYICTTFVSAQKDSIPVGLSDDIEPYFKGGMIAMRQFIANEFKYPDSAIEHGFQGKVHLRFVVQKDGEIRDINVRRGIPGCPECDAEAVRIVSKMPPWMPATRNGMPIDSYFNCSIIFRIQ